MRGRALIWLLLGAGVVTLLALALFGSQQPPPSTHSSTSDAADGTSALARAAAATGRPVERLTASPAVRGSGLLFIFSPSQPYSGLEAAVVGSFVDGGGVVVYASETGDPALEAEFGLTRDAAPVQDLVAYPPGPLLPGVHEVSGGAQAQPFVADAAGEVPLLRGPRQEVLALELHRGRGLLVALADPLILCNGYLLRSDNARFAADLLGLAPAGGQVAFDESHHLAAAPVAPAQPGGGVPPWIAAIAWAVLVLYCGLALRGRAFGPPIPAAPARARSSAEYVEAVSTLLRRSGGRRQALDILSEATGRAQRARRWRPGADLEASEVAAGADASESSLLEAARRLHRLAYPESRS